MCSLETRNKQFTVEEDEHQKKRWVGDVNYFYGDPGLRESLPKISERRNSFLEGDHLLVLLTPVKKG